MVARLLCLSRTHIRVDCSLLFSMQIAVGLLNCFFCLEYSLTFDVNLGVVLFPILFPLSFSINACYERREKVLEYLANLKSNAAQFMHCFCETERGANANEAKERTAALSAVNSSLDQIMNSIADTLAIKSGRRRRPLVDNTYILLRKLAKLSGSLPNSLSRLQFMQQLEFSFEQLRKIRDYRSPVSLTAFTRVAIICLPIILGPYYAYLSEAYGTWTGYYCAILVSFLFGCVQNIQTQVGGTL